MRTTYSTYEAKAHLSEILRSVAAGASVVITSRGRPVAEVRAVPVPDDPFEARVADLARRGGLVVGDRPGALLDAVKPTSDPGALSRFLDERAHSE